MPVNDVLISTKFHLPSANADFIPRPQLFQLLEQGLHQPLTLVSAPPGFGKTTLVASWLQSRDAKDELNIAWLSLDEGDNTLGMFWQYFVAAIQQAQPNIGETAQGMLASPVLPELHSILGSLINELAGTETPLLIVLDDYHLVHSPEIHNDLNFFLDHIPQGVHLFVLTREDPQLTLARRRARRQVVEIRATDLRFNTQETSGFLNDIRKLDLNSEQIDLLEQRTEGWVAGLEMAALSLQDRDAKLFFESFSGDDRYIADYLIEEVLERQDETVRAFLLKTSILEHLSVPLCMALVGKSINVRATLDYIEHANLFLIPLDNHREWYRYHHLFAELLNQRLSEAYSADEIATLKRSASEWYASQGNIPAAVRYACQIPDTTRAIELLEQHAKMFFASNLIPQFVDLVQNLPREQIHSHPNLCMGIAWASLATGGVPSPWLELIEQYYGQPADTALGENDLDVTTRAALLEVIIIRQQAVFEAYDPNKRSRLLLIQHRLDTLPEGQNCLFNTASSLKPVIQFNLGLDAEQAGDAKLAAQYFTETIQLARQDQNYHLYFLSLAHLANVQISQSHLQAAYQTHEQALSSTASSVSPFAALARAGLSALHYEWGNLDKVKQHLAQGLPLARLWSNWESLIPLTLINARLEHRQDNLQKALSILDELKTSPFEGALLPLEVYAALLRSYSSDQDSASAWLATKGTPSMLEVNVFNEAFLLDVARLMLSLHHLDDTIALAQKIMDFAERGERTHPLIQSRVILAKAFSLRGNSKDGAANLGEALRLAMPEKYLSTFVDEGEPIRDLLNDIKGKLSPELRAYATQILTGFSVGEKMPVERETGIGSDLSEREKEILSLIAEGLSNQEIAEKLVISISTVKTHVGNIFNKLGVTGRTRALARAEELGLLLRR